MKIKILLFSILFNFYFLAQGQVGINTKNPSGIFHIDGKGDNSNPITTNEANNDFIVTSEGNVGIGTIAPQKKLTINGNFSAINLKKITPSSVKTESYENLYIDQNLGELLIVNTDTTGLSNAKMPINFISYTLTEVNNIQVLSYNTKISSKEYMLAIIGYELSTQKGDIGLKVSDTSLGNNATFTGIKIQAIDNGETWILSLNYPGSSVANTSDIGKVQWIVNCLAITKSAIQILDDQVFDLVGKNSYTAPSYPKGL